MWRTGLVGVTMGSMVVAAGCRHCGDDHPCDSRILSNSRAPDCRDCAPVAMTRPGPVPTLGTPYATPVSAGQSYNVGPIVPVGPAYPVYPVYPSAGTVAVPEQSPSNELPYPTIPSPGVPATPGLAQPMPATPMSGPAPAAPARTTAEPRPAR
ncbi:hypothetical protein [Fimbriiglobus ruber]|nr:hypothetical protein [Fimbriiglobus ruber]